MNLFANGAVVFSRVAMYVSSQGLEIVHMVKEVIVRIVRFKTIATELAIVCERHDVQRLGVKLRNKHARFLYRQHL